MYKRQHMGRPSLEIPDSFSQIKELYLFGEISSRQAAEILGISATTFLRWVKATGPEAPESIL